mmetsp:Transcript_20109/g.29897  ORF Transcript_20109/g.29897 Transcript_20109/m.29897 type:complete len:237 (+) Transcript_20109:2072-2782(+)
MARSRSRSSSKPLGSIPTLILCSLFLIVGALIVGFLLSDTSIRCASIHNSVDSSSNLPSSDYGDYGDYVPPHLRGEKQTGREEIQLEPGQCYFKSDYLFGLFGQYTFYFSISEQPAAFRERSSSGSRLALAFHERLSQQGETIWDQGQTREPVSLSTVWSKGTGVAAHQNTQVQEINAMFKAIATGEAKDDFEWHSPIHWMFVIIFGGLFCGFGLIGIIVSLYQMNRKKSMSAKVK